MSAGGSYVDALAQPFGDVRRIRTGGCATASDASSSGDNDDDIGFSLFPQLYGDINSSLAEHIVTNADCDKLSLKLRGIKKIPAGVSDKAAAMPTIIRLAMLLRKISEMDSRSTRKQLTAGSGFISPPVGRTDTDRYKTELCRPYEETGLCKYGTKCQFAHGSHELRLLRRHPKYKTERCRTFHTTGFCPYGPRCHFVHHEADVTMKTATPNAAQMTSRKKNTHQLMSEDDRNVSGFVSAQCAKANLSSARQEGVESVMQAMAGLGLGHLSVEKFGQNCDGLERWCGSPRLACPVVGKNSI